MVGKHRVMVKELKVDDQETPNASSVSEEADPVGIAATSSGVEQKHIAVMHGSAGVNAISDGDPGAEESVIRSRNLFV